MTKTEYIAKFGEEAYNKILERNRKSYQKRKDVWRKTREKYYQNNKDYFDNHNYEYTHSVSGRARQLLYSYRFNDKKYNRGECTLTYEWLMENIYGGQHCVYCDESNPLVLGCDRIDNSLPHTPENVVPCCKKCNLKKQKLDRREYIDFIVANY